MANPLPPATRPTTAALLCISGHDPSGGAGIQADIETLTAFGQPCVSLISCLTVQDSRGLSSAHCTAPELFEAQADALLADIAISGIKLGALGDARIARITARLIQQLRTAQPDLPVIVDPVLKAGGGGSLSDTALLDCLRNSILPLATLATPNHDELQQLGSVRQLLDAGCQWLLLTQTDSSQGEDISHHLHGPAGEPHSFSVPRLDGHFHGSGCTLAAAIAALAVQGASMPQAVEQALAFTQRCLERARPLGQGQLFPNRSRP
ncbi:MAG: bifunctional hydroxymethylpyrimidine kinase/phosphomethylpyrimidine kinase [Nevskiales bacterium]